MVEGACHSDCNGHTGTLKPHTDDSWPHATCLDTPRILTISRLKGSEHRKLSSLKNFSSHCFPLSCYMHWSIMHKRKISTLILF